MLNVDKRDDMIDITIELKRKWKKGTAKTGTNNLTTMFQNV